MLVMKNAIRKGDDAGSSLVAVLIVMLVLTVAGLTLASIVVNTSGIVTDSRARAESRATADAGLAATVAALKRGELACPTAPAIRTATGVKVSADTGALSYDYAITCTSTTATVRVNADVRGARTAVQAEYAYSSSLGEGGDMVFFGTNDITFNSNVIVTDPGRKVNVVVPQASVKCNATIPGNLTLKGDLHTQSGCNVSGSVAAGGTLTMCCGSDTFHGDLTLRGTGTSVIRGTINGSIQANGALEFGWEHKTVGQSVSTTGNVMLGNVRIQGKLTLPASKTLTNTNDAGIVVGGVDRPTTVPPVPPLTLPTWFEYRFAPADWPGYAVVTLAASGTGPGTCGYFNQNPGSGWTWLSTLAADTIIDARACTGLDSENGSTPVVQLKKNLVLLAHKFDLGSLTVKAATSATTKPSLVFLTEDRTPTDTNPTCASNQGTLIINGTVIEPSVRAMGYTPCTIDVGSKGNDQWTGTLYGGTWTPGGLFTFTADPIGLPGMGSEHGISIETKTVGVLLRQRDVTYEMLGSWTP